MSETYEASDGQKFEVLADAERHEAARTCKLWLRRLEALRRQRIEPAMKRKESAA